MNKLAKLRAQYSAVGLTQSVVAQDPMVQFQHWFTQACEAEIAEPNAMLLATLSDSPAPSQRSVLMKEFTQDGLVFYTNHGSRKAQQIQGNNAVSAVFPWYALHRQVIIEGHAERLNEQSSLAYFHSRSRAAQLGAWASRQSETLPTRQVLEERLARITERFHGQQVPLPEFWGGYCIRPHRIEFWQGQLYRLHDRILYTRDAQSNWHISRLSP